MQPITFTWADKNNANISTQGATKTQSEPLLLAVFAKANIPISIAHSFGLQTEQTPLIDSTSVQNNVFYIRKIETKAHWKNVPLATFVQNNITLLFVCLTTHFQSEMPRMWG